MNVRNLLLVSALTICGCSSPKPYTGEKVTKTSVGSGTTVTQLESRSVLESGGLAGTDTIVTEFAAPVVALDRATRVVSLQTSDGKRIEVKAGPEVRNFDQIKVGDHVRLAYVESIDFESREPTKEEVALADQEAIVAARAPRGGTPAGLVGAGETMVLVVNAIDQDNGTIQFKRGQDLLTVKAKYPQNLRSIKPGQPVVVKVTQVVAARIDPIS